MQDLKITLVQAEQIWENKQANFDNYSKLLQNCTETDLIVLPEMFNTGFSMNAEALAEDIVNSPSIDWLRTLSKEKSAAIYTSLIVKETNLYFNRGVFIEPNGTLHTYDKRQLFSLAKEDETFTAGTIPTLVKYKGWNINLQICYDLRFPEISLNFEKNRIPAYDLSLYVANWPERRIHHWNSLLIARAIENQSYVIGVNRIGVDGNFHNYSGESQTIDPNGEVFKLPSIECHQTILLSHHLLQETRKKLPFLKDRK